MKKRIGKYIAIAFDIDGTIVKPVSSWRYIHEKLGNWDILACRYQDLFNAGKISYRQFCKLDASHWKGMSESKIAEIFSDVPYTKHAKECLIELKRKGFFLIALSTGLQYIAEKLKKEIGFNVVVSNRLLSNNGILTGGVRINISHGEKGKILKKILGRYKILPEETICVGDSEGDIPMLKLAGFSIAFNSVSDHLSQIANYVCKTDDFCEIMDVINKICQGD
jgi:Haloacid Dehalogenase superfamily, subfamily IB, phosphoserine phosphatase-like